MVKITKNNLSLIILFILVATPIVLWFFINSGTAPFSSLQNIFHSLGQLTGLLGVTILSINFIITSRYRFLDKLFSNFNNVYARHHIIGAISFGLLLFHPTFLILQHLSISLKEGVYFLYSPNNFAKILGELAFLVFVYLIIATFYFNFKDGKWKNIYQYLGVVLIFGFFHMFLISNDLLKNVFLKYYMLALVALGVCSYLYRNVLELYKYSEYKYKLEEIKKINGRVVELILTPLDQKIKFKPGQRIFVRFKKIGILSESRAFSLTSIPEDDKLSFAVKNFNDYASAIYLLYPGINCFIEGPFGSFSYEKGASKRQVWVAGGIGITPFLSMARQLNFNKNNKEYKIDLYYSTKNFLEAAFSSELNKISNSDKNFRFYEHSSERDGHLTAALIYKNMEDPYNSEIFLCGPIALMQGLREQFLELGLSNDKIHSEEFSL